MSHNGSRRRYNHSTIGASAMKHDLSAVGIDIAKHVFHLVGMDDRGTIIGSVSKVDIATPMPLTYKALFPIYIHV
jgi:hypothetical protein